MKRVYQSPVATKGNLYKCDISYRSGRFPYQIYVGLGMEGSKTYHKAIKL